MKIIQNASQQRFHLTSDEKLLIDQIIQQQPNSRTSLSAALNVSPAWITKMIKPMMSRNLLEERGEGEKSGGRRAKLLGISRDVGHILGLDLGMNSIKIGISNLNVQDVIFDTISFDGKGDARLSISEIINQIQSCIKNAGLTVEKLRGIGLCLSRPVNDSESTEWPARSPLRINEMQVVAEILNHFPDVMILADRDVCLMALGEKTFGEDRRLDNFIYLKIGNRIAAGIVCQGKIIQGTSGYAGEIGHLVVDESGPLCHCGKQGCLVAMAGGHAIARGGEKLALSGKSGLLSSLYKEKNALSAIDVAEAASQGDLAALELIDHSGEVVGKVLTKLVSFFNPGTVIIGGGVSHIGHRFLKKMHQVVLREASPMATRDLRIEYSQLGEKAGVLGALKMMQSALFVESPQ